MNEKAGKGMKMYLTSWQKRMVQDLTSEKALKGLNPKEIDIVAIEFKPGGCLASYKLPPDGIRIDDYVLYLTDEQMVMASKELGLRERVTGVNISPQALESGEVVFG